MENGKRCCHPNEAASIKMLKSWIFIWLAKSKTSGGIWWGHSHSWLQWMLDANPRMGPEEEMLKTNSLSLTTYIEMRSKRTKSVFLVTFQAPHMRTWKPPIFTPRNFGYSYEPGPINLTTLPQRYWITKNQKSTLTGKVDTWNDFYTIKRQKLLEFKHILRSAF